MSYFFVGDLNVLRDARLSPIDKLVYFNLVAYMKATDGKCWPRYATIKKDLGISRASINRAVHHLAKLNLITIKRLSSTNLYLMTQQMELEKNRIKRLKAKFDTTEVSQSNILIKPSLYKPLNTRYVNKYQRGRYSQPPTAKHSGTSIEYNGEQYTYIAEETEWIEYRNTKGDKVAKHKYKKDEPIKKFDATLKVAS